MTSALLSEVGRGEGALGATLPDVPLTPEEVGARIASAREEKPWSQFDLALAFGVSPSSIYRWEKGKLPSVNDLLRLAEVLDKPSDYLTEPPERRAEIADLHDLLEELRAEGERGREAALESLASIDARLSQIEQQLAARGGQGQAHP